MSKNRFMGILPIFMVIFGTIKLLFIKYIDKKSFDNPFVQTYMMFFGESLCFVIYYAMSKKKYDKLSIIKNILVLIIPTLLDTLSTILTFKAISLTDLSEFQLLKTFNLPLIKCLSYFIHSTKVSLIQGLGLLIIMGNCIYIIINSFTNDPEINDNFDDKKSGLIMVIICQFISCFQLIYEEYFLKCLNDNEYSHLYIVGIEGILGQIFLLTGFITQDLMGKNLVDLSEIFNLLNENDFLYPIILLLISLICIDHGMSMFIIKEFSSITRIIIDIIKIMLITTFSVVFQFEEINKEKVISYNILLLALIIYGSESLQKKEEPLVIESDSEPDSENQQYQPLIEENNQRLTTTY